MVIDWTVFTYLVVGIFILVGFSSGWWKEAIVAFFLGILVFFLQNPAQAASVIDGINGVITKVYSFLPGSIKEVLGDPFQLDPSSPTTWLGILIIGLVIATQIGRLGLPGSYNLRPLGRLLGAAIGGINGLIAINLVREYMDGRGLPGSPATMATAEITVAGASSYGPAASEAAVAFTDLPSSTILDSAAPWLIVGIAVFLVVAALISSFAVKSNSENMKKISRQRPFGYR